MRHLEKTGQLDRAIEFLPSDEQIAERKTQGRGLTSPELAVLLAYSKMWLSDELVASDLPEDPWVASALQRYFPPLLREKFAAYIPRHPLKREIIATHVLNRMVNRVGPTFVHRLTEMTGAKPSQIVRAYLATREVFCFGTLWKQIEALDNRVADAVQAAMINHMRGLSARATTWFLHPRRLAEGMQPLIDRLTPAVAMLRARLEPAAAGVAAGGRLGGRRRARDAGAERGRDRRPVRCAGHCRDRRIARSCRWTQICDLHHQLGAAPGAAAAAPADRGAAGRQLLGDAGQDRARRRPGRAAARHRHWRC